MPRNGSGVFSLPPGYLATTGQDAEAAQHNDPLEDIKEDLNAARPIVAGGTGADTAEGARVALGIDPTIQVFTASGTYTPTAGARWAIVEVLGGGGGGAEASSTGTNGGAGSGGGAGAYIKSDLIDVSGESYTSTITIGAAGATGSAGGNSTYADGTITLTANGGNGGNESSDVSSANFASGANGGGTSVTAHTPQVLAAGADSFFGIPNVDANGRSIGGNGASSQYGGGGKGGKAVTSNAADTGDGATGYGAGGGGAAARGSGVSASGGSGTAGLIIITEFA